MLISKCILLLTTGITWVTPSPLSMTIPVRVRSPTCRDVQEAAKANTACSTQSLYLEAGRVFYFTLSKSTVSNISDTCLRKGKTLQLFCTLEEHVCFVHLHSNVKSWDVKGFKHDFCKIFSVFWCVQWRLCLQKQRVLKKHLDRILP